MLSEYWSSADIENSVKVVKGQHIEEVRSSHKSTDTEKHTNRLRALPVGKWPQWPSGGSAHRIKRDKLESEWFKWGRGRWVASRDRTWSSLDPHLICRISGSLTRITLAGWSESLRVTQSHWSHFTVHSEWRHCGCVLQKNFRSTSWAETKDLSQKQAVKQNEANENAFTQPNDRRLMRHWGGSCKLALGWDLWMVNL